MKRIEEGTPGEPYFTILNVDQVDPVGDSFLQHHKIPLIPSEFRPDRQLVEAIAENVDGTYLRPLLTCLTMTAEAKSCVIEHNYFDVDFRSEYSLAHAGRYATTGTPHTKRLHFFSVPVGGRDLKARKSTKLETHYMGYMILRPFGRGAIGRTVLKAPNRYFGVNTKDFALRVRTRVTEDVQLFGKRLVAEGVPFLEQDGHLIRCAHAVAWTCHFSAVLRGLVARRPTAAFYQAGQSVPGAGRIYPSEGLDAATMIQVLQRFDLGPEQIDVGQFASKIYRSSQQTVVSS